MVELQKWILEIVQLFLLCILSLYSANIIKMFDLFLEVYQKKLFFITFNFVKFLEEKKTASRKHLLSVDEILLKAFQFFLSRIKL